MWRDRLWRLKPKRPTTSLSTCSTSPVMGCDIHGTAQLLTKTKTRSSWQVQPGLDRLATPSQLRRPGVVAHGRINAPSSNRRRGLEELKKIVAAATDGGNTVYI